MGRVSHRHNYRQLWSLKLVCRDSNYHRREINDSKQTLTMIDYDWYNLIHFDDLLLALLRMGFLANVSVADLPFGGWVVWASLPLCMLQEEAICDLTRWPANRQLSSQNIHWFLSKGELYYFNLYFAYLCLYIDDKYWLLLYFAYWNLHVSSSDMRLHKLSSWFVGRAEIVMTSHALFRASVMHLRMTHRSVER